MWMLALSHGISWPLCQMFVVVWMGIVCRLLSIFFGRIFFVDYNEAGWRELADMVRRGFQDREGEPVLMGWLATSG